MSGRPVCTLLLQTLMSFSLPLSRSHTPSGTASFPERISACLIFFPFLPARLRLCVLAFNLLSFAFFSASVVRPAVRLQPYSPRWNKCFSRVAWKNRLWLNRRSCFIKRISFVCEVADQQHITTVIVHRIYTHWKEKCLFFPRLVLTGVKIIILYHNFV